MSDAEVSEAAGERSALPRVPSTELEHAGLASETCLKPLVTREEVRDIDEDDGLVRMQCGVQFEAGQVRKFEQPGDRSVNGKLTKSACERIAVDMSEIARQILGLPEEKNQS